VASGREDGRRTSDDADDPQEVALIGGDDARACAMGENNEMDVDDVRNPRLAGEGPDRMSILGRKRRDLAATEEPAELRLATGAAHLGNDGRRGQGNLAQFETRPMVGPHSSVRPIGVDERAGVVDGGHAGRRRRREVARACSATRWRAAASSESVNGPCWASHSATAARPSRTSSARLAASVIHADTLTPSSAAAASNWA